MSRVDNLLQQLRRNGAESKALGDVGTFIRGNGLQKSDLTEVGFPAIHYGQVHTYYGAWATETISFTSPDLAKKLRKAAPGDVVIATTSEDDEAVGKAVAWLGEGEAAVSGDAFIFHHTLDPKYVSYFFQSEQFQSQKMRSITGAKVRRISGESLARIKIPVPAAEVQSEIARVLDSFSALQVELKAELAARREQYSHYRTSLLTLGGAANASRWRLGEVATVRVGQAPPQGVVVEGGAYAFVNAGTTESGRAMQSNTNGSAVTIPSRGQGGVGIVGYQHDEFWCGPLCYRIVSSRDDLRTRYLYYYLKSIQPTIRGLQQTGGTPALNRKELVLVEVDIPTLEVQDSIVAILDRFDVLVTDRTFGLPAELKARRMQYEYYRDKLLNLEEVAP